MLTRRNFLRLAALPPLVVIGRSTAVESQNRAASCGVVSVFDLFDSNAQREAVRAGAADFNAAPYINEAIAHAARRGCGVVFFPAGLYLLGGPRLGPYKALIGARSSLTLRGEGARSILKVVDGFTAGGDYRIVAPLDEEPVSDLVVERLLFDGNGPSNLVRGSSGSSIRGAYCINVRRGRNIIVQDCMFRNHPGRGIVNLGDNRMPIPIGNAVIRRNSFAGAGGAIPGNRVQNDHSSIYVQADGALIEANRFTNESEIDHFGRPEVTVVAIEVHGSNNRIIGNIADKYTNGGNAVATYMPSSNNTWSGNSFSGLTNVGLALFSSAPWRIERLTVAHNVFRVSNLRAMGNTVICQWPSRGWTSSDIRQLLIEDNVIEARSRAARAGTWHGMLLSAVDGAIIRRNTISNIQGCGIDLEPAEAVPVLRNVQIYENRIVDAGLHRFATRVWGIRISNNGRAARIGNIAVHDNVIENDGSAPRMRGVLVEGDGEVSAAVAVNGNRFSGIPHGLQVQQRPAARPHPRQAG